MNPINSNSRHALRFSGVQQEVLEQLEKIKRLQEDARRLFGDSLEVFIRADSCDSGTGELMLVSSENARSLFFGSGMFRNLHRVITGQDIKPTEMKFRGRKAEPQSEMFQCTIESRN